MLKAKASVVQEIRMEYRDKSDHLLKLNKHVKVMKHSFDYFSTHFTPKKADSFRAD